MVATDSSLLGGGGGFLLGLPGGTARSSAGGPSLEDEDISAALVLDLITTSARAKIRWFCLNERDLNVTQPSDQCSLFCTYLAKLDVIGANFVGEDNIETQRSEVHTKDQIVKKSLFDVVSPLLSSIRLCQLTKFGLHEAIT